MKKKQERAKAAQPQKMALASMDIAAQKRRRLEALLKAEFPEAMSEGKVDFDALRQALGEAALPPGKERFGLNWPGKAECMRIIQQPSIATLKPARGESADFDKTENLFIEGDNLEVLKLLQKAYYGSVKMIYIDPPYNTGKEFIYPDKYAETLETYLQYTGQKDSEGRKFSTNTEADGRFHSRWLNMMYPRLYLARNLLREDGVIFISIDDNEQANLKALCDIVFGEENFVADINVINNFKGRNDKKYIATANERLLMYVKTDAFEEFGLDLPEERIKEYKHEDDGGKFRTLELRKRGGADTRAARPNMFYPIYVDPKTGNVSLEKTNSFNKKALPIKSDGVEGCWRWGIEKTKNNLSSLKGSEVGDAGKFNVYEKDYLASDGKIKRLKPKSVFGGADYSTDAATKAYKSLMAGVGFQNPKPVPIIEDLVTYATLPSEEAICLDFFAGSGTLAHAVMNRNNKDGGSRKFICVQLPEPCAEDSEAYKAGYKTIADIGRERIRRAAGKIKKENPSHKGDLGFKAFRLAPSNFKVWQGAADGALQKQLELHISHIASGSAPEDILHELLLKAGFPLTAPLQKIKMAGKEVFSIEGGELLVCLEKKLTQKVLDAMAAARPRQVICLDAGFAGNDQLKTNAVQTFKDLARRQESEVIFRTV